MQDGDIAAAIVAGEPAGLAAAYDRYAPGLHAYCRSLLTEPADAATAVQDTFLAAAAKVGGLRDPERLRPWLYAVARNECFRKLRAYGLSAPLDEPGDVTDGTPDPATGPQRPQRAELRALVVAALAGLDPGDREIIELSLRHVLDGQDLADVLGVSRSQAYALVSRARGQFEGSLGALLVARGGRRACPDLDDLLADWDGHLTLVLRKRINRHAERCDVCSERKSRELSPAMLLSLLPMVALPAALREQVLRLAADDSPDAAGYRDLVARQAGPFADSGFPRTIEPPGRVYGVRTLGAVASAAVIAAALLGAGTVYALDSLHHKGTTTVSAATLGPSAVPAPMASGSDPATGAASRHHSGGKAGSPVTVALPSPSPSPSSPGSVPPTGNPATSAPPPPPHSHSSSPTPSPPPSPGTLVVSPAAVTLAQGSSGGAYTGQFTVTAQGGPVSGYTVEDPAPSGDLAISPSSGGSLSAGQSVTITVTVASSTGLAYETDLTVEPDALTVVIDYPPAG